MIKSTAEKNYTSPKKNLDQSNSRVGRPRSETAHVAILQAAYELLYQAPAHDISVIEIAKQAGVSTATLYRWWPTKEAVLLDAYVAKVNEFDTQSTGSPLRILAQHALHCGRVFQGKHARVTLRLLVAMQENEALRTSFLQHLVGPRITQNARWLTDAIRLGDLPADTDKQLFTDAIFGVLLLRLIIGHAPINNGVVQDTFDLVVAGARNVKSKKRVS